MISSALESLPAELEAEVCIAGAGPAGIVLALELARRGRSVLLLEGGGQDSPGDGQDIYDGETRGRPYPLAGSRLRWLGGTTNHWGGWVKPLDPIDFVDKPHFPMPAWPFGLEELEPWYRAAGEWCEVGSTVYDPAESGLAVEHGLLGIAPDADLVHRLFRFSPPTRFGTRYRPDLSESDRIDCRVDLSLVELDHGDGRVRSAEARTLDGRRCTIRATHFVLAAGGLENARILLNQARVPGNQSGLVGRCFMDHYGFSPGHLLARDGLRYQMFGFRGNDVMPVLATSESLLRSEPLINSCFLLAPGSPDVHLPPAYWDNRVLRANPDRSGGLQYSITMINEPRPHPDSRVELSDQTDRLGQRRLRLHWQIPADDYTAVLRLTEVLAAVVGAHHVGRLRWTGRTPTPENLAPGVGYHHMGTTRMASSPDYGVVDPHCQVWDTDNLHLAGSSVFPTAGYSNPTLTIAALSARLAERLDSRLDRRPERDR